MGRVGRVPSPGGDRLGQNENCWSRQVMPAGVRLGGVRPTPMPLPRLSVLTDRAVSLSSFGGEGQGEEVVVLSQHARYIDAATRWMVPTNHSHEKGDGPLAPEPRLARELPRIPPLPFRRGEGWGEGSVLAPVGLRQKNSLGPPLPSPLLPRGRRGRSRRVLRGNILNSTAGESQRDSVTEPSEPRATLIGYNPFGSGGGCGAGSSGSGV